MSRVTLCVVVSVAFVAWASGCCEVRGSDLEAPIPAIEPSREGPRAECPPDDASDAPQEGEPCTQPEGTTCAVGACSEVFVACRRGAWIRTELAPKTPTCPSAAPRDGEICPPCFPASLLCGFGCEQGTFGFRAVCTNDADGGWVWRVTSRACVVFDAGRADDADADDADADDADADDAVAAP